MKMQEALERLTQEGACGESMDFARGFDSPAKAWKECQRGDWMIWLLAHIVQSNPNTQKHRKLIGCVAECYELRGLPLLKDQEDRDFAEATISQIQRYALGDLDADDVYDAALYHSHPWNTHDLFWGIRTARPHMLWCVPDIIATNVARGDAARGANVPEDVWNERYTAELAEIAKIVRRHYPNPPKL